MNREGGYGLFFLVVLIIFVLSTPVRAQSSPAEWTPELAMKVKNIGAVRISPDGKRVAFTASEALMTPEKSEYVAQIWLA